ncbi:MAG TPA: ABC transporter substrate-binding protein [Steroidobacteraceae bacterium]|jgi:phospholipid transport system substrate-binding protein|nr:ABC transporter substrate-binding protein [Steroidobacteraceae bacterium]
MNTTVPVKIALGALVVMALSGVMAARAAPPAPAAAPAAAVNAQDPTQLVQDVASNILKALDANRAAYANNPKMVRELADKYLLPYFDTQYAAQLVLGRYWRSATEDQRMRFIEAFKDSMLQNYGNALVNFTANRLKVQPGRVDPASDLATVSTTISRDDGSTVPVLYVLHKTPDGWKAWDVKIEGISYVKSFRDDFAAQIEQKGLEAVITRLQSGERPAGLPAASK